MQFQCECGQFRAQIIHFPANTPGRMMCYCDDCQTYLHHLGRADLLDPAGGTEIIPIYPSEIKILAGREKLKCTRLSPAGIFRWSTICCNTPVGNMRPKFPWMGLLERGFNVKEPRYLENTLGPIKNRILGKFARGTPPKGTSDKLEFKDMWVVLPFLLKGFLMGKSKNSPFFNSDAVTPIVAATVLSLEERNAVRKKIGF